MTALDTLELPDHLQRPPEEPVEVPGSRGLFGNGLFDGLFGGGTLMAEIHEHRQNSDIVSHPFPQNAREWMGHPQGSWYPTLAAKTETRRGWGTHNV